MNWGPTRFACGGAELLSGAPVKLNTRSVTVVVGMQWGDEGKGRVVDMMARDANIVARFGGGDNAGHTLVVEGRKLALRIVPSGVLVPGVEMFIGSGTVVSLPSLIEELDKLQGLGVDLSRIKISDRAHIVFPYHILADRAGEQARGSGAIGTTGRGIGPAYVDKVGRQGITFGDLRAADGACRQTALQCNVARQARLAGPCRAQRISSRRRSRLRSASARTSSTASPTFTTRSHKGNASSPRARKRRCSTSASERIRS